MSNSSQSFTVSFPRIGNQETFQGGCATTNETRKETYDLLALSARVLARSKGNQVGNFNETQPFFKFHDHATLETRHERELKRLIQQVGAYCKATDSEVMEMVEDTLKHHAIDVALTTFRSLATQIPKGLMECNAVNDSETVKRVTCASCVYFQRDSIGFGAGIGKCEINAWKANSRQPALYPNAKRICNKFQNKVIHD